ncbi:MAG: hypothetical protein JRJ85_04385, partial [Deltaproteobacteria bacterium]|nr:hypothetical protein [Deltaproteobacteria bacterium]
MKKKLVCLVTMVCMSSMFVCMASKTAAQQQGRDALVDDFDHGPGAGWRSVNGDWTMINGMYTLKTIKEDTLYVTYP